jgi:uncharacterized membrane protein YjgN (DUF898 family)
VSQEKTPAATPFQFTGRAGEFFKIWIVNVLLAIVTLGIYSAWAKVRTTGYFYSHTRLDNTSFEYLGDPVAILKGRLIAFGVLILYIVTTQLYPVTEPLFVLALVVAMPWLVVQALRFRARNSAYRNIRFDFEGSYREAIAVFIGLPLLTLVTLGLAYPYFVFRKNEFVVRNSGYGAVHFGFKAMAKGFYFIYLKALAALLLGGLLISTILFGVMAMGMGVGSDSASLTTNPLVIATIALPLSLLYLWVGIYVRTAVANLIWSHVSLDWMGLRSTLKTNRMVWLYVSNTLAIIGSLGVLIPWARIRMARYRVHSLVLVGSEELDRYVAVERKTAGTTGEGLSDVFDVAVGI